MAAASHTDDPKEGDGLEQFRSRVLTRGQTRSYRPSTVVVYEGDPADALYWILEGELSAYTEDEEGRVFELSRMHAGEYFGELLFASPVRTASVRTATAAKLCRISRHELEALLMEEPAIALEVIRMLTARLASLTGTVRGIALSDVYSRLQHCLLERAVGEEGQRRVDDVSQQELAERVGASKSMVNRILKDLQSGGYVSVRRRCIYILKPLPKRW